MGFRIYYGDESWKNTVFSDGSPLFVSCPEPALRDVVTVRLRMARQSPVSAVYLRVIINGEMEFFPMQRAAASEDDAFAWYQAELTMTQYRLAYVFCLILPEGCCYYNQQGLSDYSPDRAHDFVLLADYHAPAWVKGATFYQIFPERFFNGDPSISVREGEYRVDGFAVMQISDWNTPAGPYEQCHCADFYGGDLIGIRKKIPYLKELGITALYLNPIFRAPSVHKYDCVDYLAVDPHFGGDQALADLTAELHRNGMKLILDISINHTGTAHRWFNKDAELFDPSTGAYNDPNAPERAYYMFHEDGSYECWAGTLSLPKLDFSSRKLRMALYGDEDSVLKKWLKAPYCIDGWRFDVADVMANYNEQQLADEVWPEIRRSIRDTNPEAYLLAEHWDDCTDRLQGDSWDAAMNYYGFGRIIRQFYDQPDPSVERDPLLARATSGISAENFAARVTEYLSRLPFGIRQVQYNLFDSHDIGRLSAYPGMNAAKFRGAVLALFTMPGAASVYYGDEAGIGGATGYFEGARYPMPWDSGFEKTENYRLHRALAHMRADHVLFADGSFCFLYAREQVIAFCRFNDAEAFLTVISAAHEPRQICLDTAVTGRSFAAAAEAGQDYLGNAIDAEHEGSLLKLKLPAWGSALIMA